MKIKNLFDHLSKDNNTILVGAKAGLGLSTKIFDSLSDTSNCLVIDRLQVSCGDADVYRSDNDLTEDFLRKCIEINNYKIVLINKVNNKEEMLLISKVAKDLNIKIICLVQLNSDNKLNHNNMLYSYYCDKFYKLNEDDELIYNKHEGE